MTPKAALEIVLDNVVEWHLDDRYVSGDRSECWVCGWNSKKDMPPWRPNQPLSEQHLNHHPGCALEEALDIVRKMAEEMEEPGE
jgi:hypothetical protein